MTDLQGWIGREREEEDELDLFHARAMAALLDRDPKALQEGSPLPPGWHWLYFRPIVQRSDLGEDGHRRLGTFLPPILHSRRMWAGGTLAFHDELRLGETLRRRSTIESVEEKEGRSGHLVFVTVRHHLETDRGLAVDEAQQLVYREPSADPGREGPSASEDPSSSQGPGEAPTWAEPYTVDHVTLFHFSALTYNGHRIHYDHPYATEVEGYPGVVVHGPLLALLLLDGAARHGPRPPDRFSYRARSPLFAGEPFRIEGGPGETGALRVTGRRGVPIGVTGPRGVPMRITGPRGVAMRASAHWDAPL